MCHRSVAVYLTRGSSAVGGYDCDVRSGYPGYVLLTEDPLSLLRLCCVYRNTYVIRRKRVYVSNILSLCIRIIYTLRNYTSMLYLNICTLIHKRAHANADLHTHNISLSIDLLYIYPQALVHAELLHSSMYLITLKHKQHIFTIWT